VGFGSLGLHDVSKHQGPTVRFADVSELGVEYPAGWLTEIFATPGATKPMFTVD